MVGWLLRSLGESDASSDTTTLSQRGPIGLIRLVDGCRSPQGGRSRGERKGRWARKNQGNLGEGKIDGLDRNTGSDGSGLHRARSGERLVLRGGGRRRLLERDTVVLAIIVIPPFADTGCSEPSDEDDGVLGKLLLVKLEMDYKAETVPFVLLGASLAACKPSDRITYSPRSRERRREMSERVDVLAKDLRSGLPVVKGKPESNLLLESDVADKDGAIKGSRSGLGKRETLDVDVCVGVGAVREQSGLIGIDDWEHTLNGQGRRGGRVREGVS